MFVLSTTINETVSRCLTNPVKLLRYGHTMRGKPPGIARSLDKRLQEEQDDDFAKIKPVNIGLPQAHVSRKLLVKERNEFLVQLRSNPDFEKKARSGSFEIDLKQLISDNKNLANPYQIRNIAQHYRIYQDLFGLATFVPRKHLEIQYNGSDDLKHPVFFGNILLPSDTKEAPKGRIDNAGSAYHTLVLVNPDGHFSGEPKEYVHWFKGNISNGNADTGEDIVQYLQPIPQKGIGYQRYIFIAYEHNEKINFEEYSVKNRYKLDERTFSTYEFYKKLQKSITPVGLAFFQSVWDKSLPEFLHNVLGIQNVTCEYDFPDIYIANPEWFPLRRAFNTYLDRHRDQREVNKDYLLKKLKHVDPFIGSTKPVLRFPNAHPIRGVPSWLHTQQRKDRLGYGRINEFK